MGALNRNQAIAKAIQAASEELQQALVRQRHGRDTRQIWIFAAIWVGIALLPALLSGQSNIAWEAHVGGFLFGLLAFSLFDPPADERMRRALAAMPPPPPFRAPAHRPPEENG